MSYSGERREWIVLDLGPLTCQSTQLAYAGISFVRQKNTSECCISARAVNKRARRATHQVNVWRVSGRSRGSCESQISENVLLRVSSASVGTLVHTASRYHRSVPSNYCFLLPKSSVCSLGRALGSRWWVFPLVWRGEKSSALPVLPRQGFEMKRNTTIAPPSPFPIMYSTTGSVLNNLIKRSTALYRTNTVKYLHDCTHSPSLSGCCHVRRMTAREASVNAQHHSLKFLAHRRASDLKVHAAFFLIKKCT